MRCYALEFCNPDTAASEGTHHTLHILVHLDPCAQDTVTDSLLSKGFFKKIKKNKHYTTRIVAFKPRSNQLWKALLSYPENAMNHTHISRCRVQISAATRGRQTSSTLASKRRLHFKPPADSRNTVNYNLELTVVGVLHKIPEQ